MINGGAIANVECRMKRTPGCRSGVVDPATELGWSRCPVGWDDESRM